LRAGAKRSWQGAGKELLLILIWQFSLFLTKIAFSVFLFCFLRIFQPAAINLGGKHGGAPLFKQFFTARTQFLGYCGQFKRVARYFRDG
jgi:hypothetical protein